MFIPSFNIDILYDYLPLLGDDPLCKIPASSIGTEVAIIGVGPAGLIAALELLKMGLKPVIYEATDLIGGRLYSRRFEQIQEEVQPFAEMGAMRIPLSSRIFFHYAKKMNIHYDKICPSPGNVKTAIYFRGKVYSWEMNTNPPDPFMTIQSLWRLFTEPLIDRIHKEWEIGNFEKVRQLSQLDIDQYKNMSLYQALIERSPLSSAENIDIFGALGIGHGGFHPFFHISFLEILRVLVNGYMSKSNVLITEGLSEFINQLYHLKVATPFGIISLADTHCVRLNLPVVLFDYNNETNNPVIVTKDKNNKRSATEYSVVIFTGTLSALNLLNITNKTKNGVYLMNTQLCNAIKNSQMTGSSKTYICTEN